MSRMRVKPSIETVVKWMKNLGMDITCDQSAYATWGGRQFRVLLHPQSDYIHDTFQVCDGDFDRWANSVGFEITPCPRTEREFRAVAATFIMLGETVNSPPASTGEKS